MVCGRGDHGGRACGGPGCDRFCRIVRERGGAVCLVGRDARGREARRAGAGCRGRSAGNAPDRGRERRYAQRNFDRSGRGPGRGAGRHCRAFIRVRPIDLARGPDHLGDVRRARSRPAPRDSRAYLPAAARHRLQAQCRARGVRRAQSGRHVRRARSRQGAQSDRREGARHDRGQPLFVREGQRHSGSRHHRFDPDLFLRRRLPARGARGRQVRSSVYELHRRERRGAEERRDPIRRIDAVGHAQAALPLHDRRRSGYRIISRRRVRAASAC